MADVDMKALLEAGVHFGHRTQKWDPKMRPYIFTERNGIHIIDLEQTVTALDAAYKLVRDLVAEGGIVLFVGTKRQAVETIEAEAQRAEMPFVTVRWLGGMLTNWQTMRQRINELERLERMRERGDFDRLTKREALSLTRLIEKLEERFGGIRHINRLPDLLFVVDVRREETAVREANILGVPVLGLVDTNCDPTVIDHVIPSNDDAIRAIKLMVSHMADAALEGLSLRKDEDKEPKKGRKAPAARPAAAEELTDEELLGEATLAKVAEAQAEAEAEEKAKAEEEAKKAAEEAEQEAEEGVEGEAAAEDTSPDEAKAEEEAVVTEAEETEKKKPKKSEAEEEKAEDVEEEAEPKKKAAKKKADADKDEEKAEEEEAKPKKAAKKKADADKNEEKAEEEEAKPKKAAKKKADKDKEEEPEEEKAKPKKKATKKKAAKKKADKDKEEEPEEEKAKPKKKTTKKKADSSKPKEDED